MMKLQVNQTPKDFQGDPQTPLLWVLRDHLQLTSVKYGCGQGLCGACSVHVDGALTRSCSVSAEDVQGQKISTLEGLPPRIGQAIHAAWIELDVPQCGYCQSGMQMAAAALLKDNIKPSNDDINDAMKKNVCRCGTYSRIRKAIQLAAQKLA
jgi:isoquinoline 1-oxidoreductase subunit alpha